MLERWWNPRRAALIRRVLGYLRPYRRPVAAIALCAGLQALLVLVPIVMLKLTIEELSAASPRLGPIVLYTGVSLAAAAAAAAVDLYVTYATAAVGEHVITDVRQELFEGLLDQSTGFYARERGGDLLSRILTDVSFVQYTLSSTLLTILNAGLAVVSTFVFILVLDWRLAVCCLLLVPLVAVPTLRAGRRMSDASERVQEQYGRVTSYLQETLGLSGMLLVRAFGRQATERDRFATLLGELRRREVASAVAARGFRAGLAVATMTAPALVLLAGGYLITHDQVPVSAVLVIATVVAGRLVSSLQDLSTSTASALSSTSVWRRIFALIDLPSDLVEVEGPADLQDPRGAISIRDVRFTYAGQQDPALKDVSVDVAPGQLVAVVGPSGAGKTTLMMLVARLLDPSSGSIRLDGHDLRELSFDTLSRAFGIVFQDTFLFHASLRENVVYGRPDATDEEVRQAIRDAYLDPVTARLPDGLDTLVGERGHRMSGGEKQRVALARAILKDPPVLLLDEATSHLDSASELLVQEGLERLLPGRTSIVIAHRLSTVRRADVVLVLDSGRLVEQGTHQELLHAGGLYSELHAMQGREASGG